MDSLEAARKTEPGSAYVHLVLGELYFRKQDYLKAQESLETATRLSPQDSRQAFGLLVQIALRHEDASRATQYLEVMKQYFPSDPETLKLEDDNSIRCEAVAGVVPPLVEFLRRHLTPLSAEPSYCGFLSAQTFSGAHFLLNLS